MLLDDFRFRLTNFSLLERIGIPCLEAILLRRRRIANAFSAVCLEDHKLKGTGLWSGHSDESQIGRMLGIQKIDDEEKIEVFPGFVLSWC
jgi:hypothetical protein